MSLHLPLSVIAGAEQESVAPKHPTMLVVTSYTS